MNMPFRSHACMLEPHTGHLGTFWAGASEVPNIDLQTHPQHSMPVSHMEKHRLLPFIAQRDAGFPL